MANHGDISELSADDDMTNEPMDIRADAEDIELPRRFAEGRIRRLPVVEDDGRLVGPVTLDDLVAVVGEEMKDIATVIQEQSPAYAPK